MGNRPMGRIFYPNGGVNMTRNKTIYFDSQEKANRFAKDVNSHVIECFYQEKRHQGKFKVKFKTDGVYKGNKKPKQLIEVENEFSDYATTSDDL
jgi:hypothetical protein